MNRMFLATSLLTACTVAAPAHAEQPLQIDFVDHLQVGLNEIDIFVTRPGVPGEAYRVSPNTALVHLASPLYASAEPVPHNPFDDQAIGPHPLGRPLGLSLRDWRAAEGSAEVHCRDGQATVNARFTNLVPNATYSLWYAFVPSPPTEPFTGALDLPLGARDGSQSALHSDAAGTAEYHASFAPCLQASSEQLMAMLALAWHSDGQTHGSSPGEFGSHSHVQLFAPLPPVEH